MDLDVLARRGALAAIPLLALAIYFLRSDPEATRELPAGIPSAAPSGPSAAGPGGPGARPAGAGKTGAGKTGAGLGSALPAPATPPQIPDSVARGGPRPSADLDRFQAMGERALATPPPTLPQAAADLPPVAPADNGAQSAGIAPNPELTGGACGGVWVRLITTSKDPAWSFASIAPGPGQETKMRRVGDAVGNWKVHKIEWDRVWLASGGTQCAVGIHAGAREARKAALKAGAGKMLEEADSDPAPWQVPYPIAQGIRKRSETEFQISEAALDAIFEHGTTLLSGLSLEPVTRGGQVVGFQIGRVKPDSLLERLGVQSGDIVLAINEASCTALEATLEALAEARKSGVLVVRMEREGQAFDLEIKVLSEEPG